MWKEITGRRPAIISTVRIPGIIGSMSSEAVAVRKWDAHGIKIAQDHQAIHLASYSGILRTSGSGPGWDALHPSPADSPCPCEPTGHHPSAASRVPSNPLSHSANPDAAEDALNYDGDGTQNLIDASCSSSRCWIDPARL
eukprot:scaffold3913_cov101-Isochrysis_galbana.AAC.2